MTFSVAIFPYLKTSASVRIGKLQFRSTEDVEGLVDEEATAVREISEMLFVSGDLRVRSASYAIVEHISATDPSPSLKHLIEVQAVVAYLYSQPHEIFDSLLLRPEECILHVISPNRVSRFLTHPEHHTVSVGSAPPPPDAQGYYQGYEGLFGLRRPLWVIAGSRIYPPLPHVTLNIAQDLANDLGGDWPERHWSTLPLAY